MTNSSECDLLLIHPPYNRRLSSGIIFPLGLGYLASSVIADGFTVKVLDCALVCDSISEKSIVDVINYLKVQLLLNSPKLAIGIGPCTTSAVRSIKAISTFLHNRSPEVPLIFGGPLASIPGQIDLFFDEFYGQAVVPGDGEKVICKILRCLKEKKSLSLEVPEIATNERRKAEVIVKRYLDNIQFPLRPERASKNIYRPSLRRDSYNGAFATMVVSRGCPYRCSYCLSGVLRGGEYHRRSWENVINEIDILIKGGIKSIIFYDDTFFQSPKKLEKELNQFCDLILKFGLKFSWQIEMRPNVFMALDRSLVKKIIQTGCNQINLGIETSNTDLSKNFNKIISPDELRLQINSIISTYPQFKLTGTFILGGPSENIETIKETIEYSLSLKLIYAHYYPLEIYPGTVLYNDIVKSSEKFWWYKEIMEDNLPWGELIYENRLLSRENLLELVSMAYKAFYDRPRWKEMARNQFNSKYRDVEIKVAEWICDRFNFNWKN